MRRKIILLFAVALVLGTGAAFAAPLKDIADRAECPDGMAVYRTTKNKVYLGLPEAFLGRRLLIGGAVTAVSDPGAASVGQRSGQPLCFQADLQDSLVVLSRPVTAGFSEDAELQKALERNFAPAIWRRCPILSRDGGRVVFDITPLVTKAAPRGSDFKPGGEDNTSWFGTLKAFPDNASIRLHQSVEAGGIGGRTTASMVSTVSVLVLPEEPMRPRLQDSRIGTFSTGSLGGGSRFDLSVGRDGMRPYRLANRWRIEPADPEAWQRGETVPVRKPVVWYIDDSFPEEWKQPVRDGVLAWNAAFEAFGLRDVLVVRDFPDDDPEFDPDNLRYNCIRYIPNNTQNAMGPSWADPVTGEILNASVLIYNDVARLLNNWRFVQTAQVDPRVRSKKMPGEVIAEAMVYVVSHEIGHTLGLLHNMAGSAAIPVDSLRSPTFTAVYGTTASIMDYARFNYVAQPGDAGVRLVPPSLGVYDRYAIEWLYKPVPEGTLWEEAAEAGTLIEAHAGDPWYRFGAQQPPAAPVKYDPTARTQDLGDDPVKAGDYGIANLRLILPRVAGWIADDPDYSHRKGLYQQIVAQYNRYLGHVLARIGGMEIFPDAPCVPVSAGAQKAALEWVVSQVRDCAWLDEPSLTAHFGLHSPESGKAASAIGLYLQSAAGTAVATAQANGSAYTLQDYYDDLYRLVFHGGTLTPQEKSLQRTLVSGISRSSSPVAAKASFDDADFCFGEAVSPTQPSVDISASDENPGYRLQFLGKVKKLAGKRRHSGPKADRAHYEYLYQLTRHI